ncbi:DAK2 domain-containing protein [Lysinibacillus fusiformis]|uniref:DAK2 domain-containing protein n=1 Tax=Lysinibacillus fusiformis TaxID=28031 RepID=UPI00187E9FF7|nr:DAK2 domain-containing protein [Lysinibacillus fusiformis]MBD8519957.1 DAK2 domain-containing protein [Lysinibacillus fusiformis]MED4888036.1 DAK2 domain-containing protein [Lysinibacillus fusiformis]
MQSLDGIKFAEMVQMGAHHLFQNANYVDSLNVFPVPDGDTGTNMNLSMTSGAKETELHASEHIGKTAQALSKGLLMGARGNSGVILSQLFRGFGKFIEKEATIDAKGFAGAFQAGVDTAYKAVMKPVEGTILTVAREAAKKGVELAETETDIIAVMEAFTAEAKASLDRTPDLLPVLKEVGVVDSGGQGLLFVYEGFLSSLKGEPLPEKNDATLDDLINAEHHRAQDFMNTEDIEFGYCTEIMVRLEDGKEPFNEEQFRQELSPLGDSLLVISDEEIAKVHIHSEQPGSVLSIGQKYGSLMKIKVDNMREQHSAIVGEEHKAPTTTKKLEKHPYAIVTIAMGEGVAGLLRSIGASYVIEGGQTMNPSTEDIVKAVQEIGAEKVLILPNNKNIVMAAEQAVELLEIEAAVVPTKTIPQGMAAILAFNPEAAVDLNKKTMTDAFANVKTGQVTYAVRDTSIDGVEIHKDDFMALAEGKIVLSTPALKDAAEKVIVDLVDEDAEIVTVIYGEDTTEQDATELVAFIEKNYPDVEVELFDGKQGLYPYIISVE